MKEKAICRHRMPTIRNISLVLTMGILIFAGVIMCLKRVNINESFEENLINWITGSTDEDSETKEREILLKESAVQLHKITEYLKNNDEKGIEEYFDSFYTNERKQ